MLGTVYFLKIAKIYSQQKNQYVFIAKISPRITHTQKNRQSAKILCYTHGGQNSLVISLMIPLLTI